MAVSKGKYAKSIRHAAFALLGAFVGFAPGLAFSASLLDGYGGPKGFGTEYVLRNDDQFAGPINLPFQINFYGNTYSQYFANTNGNITFQSGLGTYTPSFFPGAPQPIIAPFWADVDIRSGVNAPGSTGDDGLVWYASPDPNTVVVTWNNVGYYFATNPPSNNFQLVLKNLSPVTGNLGDFSFEFRYNDLNWTTGDASGGSGGLGGFPAVAGFDAGNGVNYYQIPGSGTAGVLDLVNSSNLGDPGVWRFEVRNGQVEPPADVPSPLPLAGLGATLAWSRRLRKRISAAG